jgi:PhnB protein
MPPKPIPEGYHSLNAYIAVDDARRAIDFYKRAFGAKERIVMPGPDGKIGHAEIEIGDSVVMLSDPFEQSAYRPPKEIGGISGGLLLYVEDVDSTVQDAVDAGAEIRQPIENMFWGDRFGQITDPFGHVWQIATHVEDVPPEEMEERAKAAMAAMSS